MNMILDNLPVGMVRIRKDGDQEIKAYERGFPVGLKDVRHYIVLNIFFFLQRYLKFQ